MKQFLVPIVFLLLVFGCKEKYTPKPRAFFRIDFPDKKYSPIKKGYPYTFEIPVYAKITKDKHNMDKVNWINVSIPQNKAELHISYYNLNEGAKKQRMLLAELMEETRKLAYKHSMKADAIDEQIFINHANRVYGTIYKIQGNAASPFQFFLTDSTQHFLRGAFYIREVPNIDSIKPVINFFEPDIIRLIESTNWN